MSPAEASLHAGQHLGPIAFDPPPSELFMCLKGVVARRADALRPRDIHEARRAVADLASGEVREELAVECLTVSSRAATPAPDRKTSRK